MLYMLQMRGDFPRQNTVPRSKTLTTVSRNAINAIEQCGRVISTVNTSGIQTSVEARKSAGHARPRAGCRSTKMGTSVYPAKSNNHRAPSKYGQIGAQNGKRASRAKSHMLEEIIDACVWNTARNDSCWSDILRDLSF